MHAHSTRYALALILILLAAGCTERAALAVEKTGDRQQLETRVKQLRADRVTVAKQARMAYLAAFQADTVTLDDVIWAIDALWKAEFDVAKTVDQRIAAHVKRIEYLWQLQTQIKALFDVGARGGEAEKMARIEYCLTDAEITLIDECVAFGKPYPEALAPVQNRAKYFDHSDDEPEAAKP
ncbi:MAG TPA: hypothetical protein VHY91_23765 [Pirellulales bacterium]|jgi:hypothetical protein|nr:hypothetical protein [Pirellulales bacterium]